MGARKRTESKSKAKAKPVKVEPATIEESTQEAIEQEVAPDQEKPERSIDSIIEEIEALDSLEFDNLQAALAYAQSSIKAILRDKKHAKFGMYTSAENMIATCRAVLNKNGLSVSPAGDSLEKIGDILVKHNDYILGHESGGTQKGSFTIPVEVPTKRDGTGLAGTYQDAVLKADTIALSYYLRGVLLLPRYDGNGHQAALEPQAEYDENFKTPQRSPQAPSTAGPGKAAGADQPLYMDDAKVDSIRKLLAETTSDESEFLKYFKVARIHELNEAGFTKAHKMLSFKLDAQNKAAALGGKVTSLKTRGDVPTPEEKAAAEDAEVSEDKLNPQQINLIKMTMKSKSKDEFTLLGHFGYTALEEIPATKITEIIEWVRT